MMVPRPIAGAESLRSFAVGTRLRSVGRIGRIDATFSRLMRISLTPNSPSAIATKLIPSTKWRLPKVKRGCAVRPSSPTVPRISPTTIIMKVLSVDPALTKLMTMSASTMRLKVAEGPTLSMSSARGGANSIRPSTLTVPPNQLPSAAMTRAGPARPFFAISWPSMQVITEAASPGMRTRIEVVDPPYIAP